ncbi:MAG: tetratricopeptide repeat protein [Acidobacteria bacterium]|nr:tetratricopeptide repeat protein [Acidobacteriota bacterium]
MGSIRLRTAGLIRGALALALASTPLAAQKTNDLIKELSRDLGQLRDEMIKGNSAQSEKIAVATALLKEALDEVRRANTSVALLDRQIKDSLKEQQNLVAAPVAGVSTKIEELGRDFAALNESVRDLTARMTKLQTQLTDIANAVKTIQAPPQPPPSPAGQAAGGPPPGVTAQQLYDGAMKDRQGGNLELAMNQFQDYLKFFPTTELAPNALFYIGDIHYNMQNYDGAIHAFDEVLEKYPENNKTPDALFMKGMALFRSDRKNLAGQVFGEVIKNYPTADVATKARSMRRAMGLPVPSPTPPQKKKR